MMKTDYSSTQLTRCSWAKSQYEIEYHDNEWCIPSYNDNYLFELLCLEGAQAGLSWNTILMKRKGYQNAFYNFDINKVANIPSSYIKSLYTNEKIIRNKLKINSVISNAQCVQKIQKEYGSFSDFIWRINDNEIINNQWESNDTLPATSQLSEKLSKLLKENGFKFVGPTICYSYLQAIGIINDHTKHCFTQHRTL